METSMMASAHSRSRTHPNLPSRITHPGLPQGKELVTQNIVISPHLASPVGEGQLLLLLISL